MKVSKVEEYIKQTVSAIKTKLLIQELQVSINNACRANPVPNVDSCSIQTQVYLCYKKKNKFFFK